MAQFTFSIPDNQVNRIIDSLAVLTSWTPTIPDPNNPSQEIPNPISKNQNAKNTIMNFMKDSVREVELGTAKRNLEDTFQDVNVT